MRKLLVFSIILLFFGMSIFPSIGIQIENKSIIISNKGNTLYVGGNASGNYSKIQDAIDNASDGDTVFVYDDSSPYYENIMIDKSINLIGENRENTIIDANNKKSSIKIYSNKVTLSGFTVKNSSSFNWGIYLEESNNSNIINNIIVDNYYGLKLNSCNNCIILNNIFIRNSLIIWKSYNNIFINNTVNDKPLIYFEDESNRLIDDKSGQIILINCENITIRNQDISNTSIAIELFETNNCNIYNNTLDHNKLYSIFLQFSNNNYIYNNSVNSNDGGIFMDYFSNSNHVNNNDIQNNKYCGFCIYRSSYNNISFNNVSNCENVALECSDGNNNKIKQNIFRNNYMGIITSGGKNNIFSQNYILENTLCGINVFDNHDKIVILHNQIEGNEQYGMFIFCSKGTIITENNFIENTCDASFEYWDYDDIAINFWFKNYWDNYKGYGVKWISGSFLGFERRYSVDFRPANKPYDIPDTSMFQGCVIE